MAEKGRHGFSRVVVISEETSEDEGTVLKNPDVIKDPSLNQIWP